MSEHLRAARAWWRRAMDSSNEADLHAAVGQMLQHFEAQESAFTELQRQVENLTRIQQELDAHPALNRAGPPLTEERVREIMREETRILTLHKETQQHVNQAVSLRLRKLEGPMTPPPAQPEPPAMNPLSAWAHAEVDSRVLVERSIHDKLDRILAWIDSQGDDKKEIYGMDCRYQKSGST